MQMIFYSILMNILVILHFFCNEMRILDIDLNNINLDDTYYDEVDHEKTIHVRRLVWHIKFEN